MSKTHEQIMAARREMLRAQQSSGLDAWLPRADAPPAMGVDRTVSSTLDRPASKLSPWWSRVVPAVRNFWRSVRWDEWS
jgi:hypothetical protein